MIITKKEIENTIIKYAVKYSIDPDILWKQLGDSSYDKLTENVHIPDAFKYELLKLYKF